MKIPEPEKNGMIKDSDGASWDNAQHYLMGYVFGFCLCGMPYETLKYIRGGLELVDGYVHNDDYDAHEKRCSDYFGSYGQRYFFYYWCDKMGYSEHGGSVPGWLSKEGKDLLAILRGMNLEDEDEA